MILAGMIGAIITYMIFKNLKISMDWMRGAKEYWKGF